MDSSFIQYILNRVSPPFNPLSPHPFHLPFPEIHIIKQRIFKGQKSKITKEDTIRQSKGFHIWTAQGNQNRRKTRVLEQAKDSETQC